MGEQLYTVTEASRLLAVSPITIRRWIWKGTIGCVRLGRSVRLRASDIATLSQGGLKSDRVLSEGARR